VAASYQSGQIFCLGYGQILMDRHMERTGEQTVDVYDHQD
jgi:hypothetical protein